MDQQENKEQVMLDLHTFFGKDVRVAYSVETKYVSSLTRSYPGAGPPVGQTGKMKTTLFLKFHMDMFGMFPDERPYERLGRLEYNMNLLLKKTNSSFLKRDMYSDALNYGNVQDYTIELEDFNTFKHELHTLALDEVNRQFAQALEAKLSED